MDFAKLGGILKQARTKSKCNQTEIARLLGMTSQNISSWELGKSKIDIESYLRLCNFYGLDATQPLMEATDGMPQYTAIFPNYEDYSGAERELIGKYRDLNPAGQTKVDENVNDLMGNDRYIRDKESAEHWRLMIEGEDMHKDLDGGRLKRETDNAHSVIDRQAQIDETTNRNLKKGRLSS